MSTTKENDTRAEGSNEDVRMPYEAPRIMKRRSLTRVTLFSGTGTSSVGFVGAAPTLENCAKRPRPPSCPNDS